MSISHYPSIVTDGMVLCLDAASLISYPGSGTSWNDLSGKNNHATLLNSPSYNNVTNKGIFTFSSSSNQSAQCPAQPTYSTFSVEVWIKFISLPTVLVRAILTQEFPSANSTINYSIGFNGANTTGAFDGKLNVGFYDGAWRCTSGFTPLTGVWYHVVLTYNGSVITQYVNGQSQSSLNYSGSPTTSGGSLILMKRWDDPDYVDGILPIARIYNRALSSDEVANNYNAMRGRYS